MSLQAHANDLMINRNYRHRRDWLVLGLCARCFKMEAAALPRPGRGMRFDVRGSKRLSLMSSSHTACGGCSAANSLLTEGSCPAPTTSICCCAFCTRSHCACSCDRVAGWGVRGTTADWVGHRVLWRGVCSRACCAW